MFSAGLLIIGIFLILYGGYSVLRAASAGLWPRIDGEILETDVEESISTDNPDYYGVGRHWIVSVRYRYKIGGRWYEGTRLSFDDNRIYGAERASDWIYRHKPGSTVFVRVNPRQPRDAVLDPSPPRDKSWWVVIGVALAGFGIMFRGVW